MVSFRKARRPADPRPAIEGFWTWWAEHRHEVLAAFAEHRTEDLRVLIGPVVATVNPSLDWQLLAGVDKKATLVVSGHGKPELRAVSERWAVSAPDDPEVRFAPARVRDPAAFETGVVHVDGFDIELRELIAGTRVDMERGAVDVVVHHPLFPLLAGHDRLKIALQGIDAALGEDDTERWLGSVEVSPDAPIDAIALSALGGVVDQLQGGPSQWVTLQGHNRRGPILAVVRRPLDRVERPMADTHLVVILSYAAGPDGQPHDPQVAADAVALEREVIAALGGEGPHLVQVGRVIGGRQSVAHFYIDGFEIDPSSIGSVVSAWGHGKASITVTLDPSWEMVAPLLR